MSPATRIYSSLGSPSKILPDLAFKLTIQPKIADIVKMLPTATIYPTGSRYICNPPVMSTDVDFVVWWPEHDKNKRADTTIIDAGYRISTLEYHAHSKWDFSCFRKGNVNLIVSASEEFVMRHAVGTDFCKRNNIRDKHHRVLVHEIVRGEFAQENMDSVPVIPCLSADLDASMKQLGGRHGYALCRTYMLKNEIVGYRYEPQTAS